MELKHRLVERIGREGPITFAEFMEAALYDPEEGFYARPPVGEDGHFVTSPHVSAGFAALLARQLGQVWDLLGRPRTFTVVEAGAGDGTLARQLLEHVDSVPDLRPAVRYVAVERSPGARAALSDLGVDVRAAVTETGPVTGCLLANEVLDNLPFHRLRERDGAVVEVMVGARDGRLVEVEAEPTPAAAEALAGNRLRPKEERPVSPAAMGFVRDVASALHRGYAFLFDYGFEAGEAPGPVHAYRDHRVLADVLEEPGSRDVTAAVDLAAVAAEAREAGLQAWGPVSQREALLGLGFRTWMQGLRSRQTEAQVKRSWRDATTLYSERNKAQILVDADKLGGLRLLVLGTEGLPPPAAALGDRQTGC
ncbi:MAG: SAM-dependent methyltransferase [Actinomycetota bacterium]